MSLVEKAILALSPKWAAERAYFRVSHAELLSYDAAMRSRHTDNWLTRGASANAEFGLNGNDLDTIIQRSRDLVRNTPYATRALSVTSTSIIGTGIVPRLNTKDRTEKGIVKDLWETFSDNCDPEGLMDFYGKQLQATRCMIESGEALIKWIPRSTDDYAFPLQCEVLEPDYIDKRKKGETAGGGYILHGVEYDAFGRRIAYWLFDRHPGETLRGVRAIESKRVPARYISPCFFPLRPGQVHGVPWFASVVLRAKDINDYDNSEVRRKKIETAIAAFVTRAGGAANSAFGKTENDSNGSKKEKVKQGTIAYLATGEDVKFGHPTHVQGYSEFMGVQLHAMAAGSGCTYEQMTGDMTGVNFSSARVALIEFYKLIDSVQWLVAQPMICKPAWRRFQDVVRVMKGDIGQGKAIWAMPCRQWVDPEKEQSAIRSNIRNGTSSLFDEIAARGEDPDEVLDRIAESNEALDARGLVLDTDPRRVLVGGAKIVEENSNTNDGGQKDA